MFWEYEVEWSVLKYHWLCEEEIPEDFSSLWSGDHHEDNDLLTVKDLFAKIEIVFPVVVVKVLGIGVIVGHCCEAKE